MNLAGGRTNHLVGRVHHHIYLNIHRYHTCGEALITWPGVPEESQ